MKQQSVDTYTAQIYIGLRLGYSDTVFNLEAVRSVCRAYVKEVGLCVTVTPTEFIYVDGGEPGAIIGLINYPRFPAEPSAIEETAVELAKLLMIKLQQNRVSIVFPQTTMMLEGE